MLLFAAPNLRRKFSPSIILKPIFFPQKLKRIEKAHSTFITGLEFLSTSDDVEPIRGCNDASVISISVDHQVCIHHIPRLRKSFAFKRVWIQLGAELDQHISMAWIRGFSILLRFTVILSYFEYEDLSPQMTDEMRWKTKLKSSLTSRKCC